MSSRFVSAGTAEEPPERDDEWLAAQKELDANALRKKEQAAAGSGIQDGGKSLFEVLQANKAAKQDAFEEAAKLKHQFRSLDDDEIDFLDSVMESTRKRELEVKKETSEQLELFRRQREEAARLEREADDPAEEIVDEETAWKVGGKKRKKGKEGVVKGLKVRKMSSTAGDGEVANDVPVTVSSAHTEPAKVASEEIPRGASPAKSPESKEIGKAETSASGVGSGLVDYSTDDE